MNSLSIHHKGNKVWYYREKVASSVFSIINENIYRSGDVQITIKPMDDEDDTFGIVPLWVAYVKDWVAYEWFVGIGEVKDIWWWLIFGIAIVSRDGVEQNLLF